MFGAIIRRPISPQTLFQSVSGSENTSLAWAGAVSQRWNSGSGSVTASVARSTYSSPSTALRAFSPSAGEFLQAVRAAVSPKGVVLANVWSRNSNPLYDSMVRTYQDVFEGLYIVEQKEGRWALTARSSFAP